MAEAPDNAVFVAGSFQNSADLGGGTVIEAPDVSLFILKLKGQDEFVWQRHYQTGSNSNYQGFDSLSVDAAGNLLLTGTANASTDFGDGALAGDRAGDEVSFIIKMDVEGHPLYQNVPKVSGLVAKLDSAGSAVVAGTCPGPFVWGNATEGESGAFYNVVAQIDAQGVLIRSVLLDGIVSITPMSLGNQTLARGPDGMVFREQVSQLNGSYAFSVVAINPYGSLAWQSPVNFQFRVVSLVDWIMIRSAISADGAGFVWAASHFNADFPVAGRSLTPVGEHDVIALRLDDRGEADSAGTFGTESDDTQSMLHATPSGAAFVAGLIADMREMFLVRFAL